MVGVVSWNIAETKSMPEVTGTLGMISKNILSAESGIWNLSQILTDFDKSVRIWLKFDRF